MRGQKHWEESQERIDNWINAFSLRRFLTLKTTDGSWESVTFSIMIVEKNLIPVSIVVHFDERWTSKKLGQSFRCRSLFPFPISLSLSLFPSVPFYSKKFVCLRVNFVKDNLPVDKMEGTARPIDTWGKVKWMQLILLTTYTSYSHLLSFRVVYVGNLNRWKKEAGPFREVESRLSARQRERKGENLAVAWKALDQSYWPLGLDSSHAVKSIF